MASMFNFKNIRERIVICESNIMTFEMLIAEQFDQIEEAWQDLGLSAWLIR